VARIELLDDAAGEGLQRLFEADLPETPLLLLEFHGTEAGVAEQSSVRRDRRRMRRRPFEWTDEAGRPHAAVAGAP
jgi:D-lactate dehydrogenase (cytochrome)